METFEWNEVNLYDEFDPFDELKKLHFLLRLKSIIDQTTKLRNPNVRKDSAKLSVKSKAFKLSKIISIQINLKNIISPWTTLWPNIFGLFSINGAP